MKQIKKFQLPMAGGIFLTAVSVYYELLLHSWTGGSFAPAQLIPVTLFAAGFGSLLGLIACLLPPKAEKIFSAAAAAVLAVACMTEFFLNESFSSFMPPSMVFKEAGGVATGFMDVVWTLMAANLWKILLVLLPIAAFLLFAEPKRVSPRRRILPGIGAVICYAAGCAAVAGFFGSLSCLSDQFSFDASVRRNGLTISTVLELAGTGGSPEEAVFVPVEIPTEPAPQITEPAEETEAPEEPVRFHMVDVDFAALSRDSGPIAQLCGYVASQVPATNNEYTGLFKGKNLILITAEAFTAEVIDPELTPTLYRMANQGIRFTDYYQPGWNGGTTGGELSNLSSLVPKPSLGMGSFSSQKPFITMGNQLQKLGYFSRAYHNNTGTFYDRNRTHPGLGYEKFIAMYSGMEEGVTNEFPQSDLEMIDFTVPQYIDHQPFSVYYITVSGHSVYVRDRNAQARKNYDKLDGTDWSEPVRCYLAANLELEYAMESLLRQLEEAGIADDTVVVLAPDHYPYGLDAGTAWGHSKSYLPELFGLPDGSKIDCFTRDHNAAIIWSGCLEGMDISVDTPTYSLDLLPTLCNLFDVEYDSRLLVGRDVFSDAIPLVLWPNYSWITDKGRYSSETNTFTPVEGAEIPDGYVDSISAMVKNKISYSHSALSNCFFAYVSQQMEKNG